MKSDGFHFLEVMCYWLVRCSWEIGLPVEDDNSVGALCVAERLEGENLRFITDVRLEAVPKCFLGASDENIDHVH